MEKELLIQILANQYVIYKKLEELKLAFPYPPGEEHSTVSHRINLDKEAASVKKLIKQVYKSETKR